MPEVRWEGSLFDAHNCVLLVLIVAMLVVRNPPVRVFIEHLFALTCLYVCLVVVPSRELERQGL